MGNLSASGSWCAEASCCSWRCPSRDDCWSPSQWARLPCSTPGTPPCRDAPALWAKSGPTDSQHRSLGRSRDRSHREVSSFQGQSRRPCSRTSWSTHDQSLRRVDATPWMSQLWRWLSLGGWSGASDRRSGRGTPRSPSASFSCPETAPQTWLYWLRRYWRVELWPRKGEWAARAWGLNLWRSRTSYGKDRCRELCAPKDIENGRFNRGKVSRVLSMIRYSVFTYLIDSLVNIEVQAGLDHWFCSHCFLST